MRPHDIMNWYKINLLPSWGRRTIMSSSDSKNPDAGGQSDSLSLTRMSRWVHLAPDSLSLIREELATALGFNAPKTNAGLRDVTPPILSETQLENLAEDPFEAQIGLKIRRLVNAGAPWHIVSELLWQRFNNGRTPQKAAQLLETAFVQAAPSETLEIFSHIMSSGLKGFYWHLHPKLRDFLVEHSPESNLDQLYWIIAHEPDDSKLSGIEHAYVFLRVITTSDKTAAWTYFRKNKLKIFDSFGTSTHFGMTKQQLISRVSELALSLGYTEDHRELFQLLPMGNPNRENMLSRPEVQSNSQSISQSNLSAEQLIQIGATQAFTNDDLLNLWRLTSKNSTPDLAWRTATILASREALPSEIRPAWEVSGERRAAYAPITLSNKEIECALSGLSTAAQLLAPALCTLGSKINEYALINGEASRSSPSLIGTSSIEQIIATAVKNSIGIPKLTKNVSEASGIHMIPSVAAPLTQAVINGPWIFAARILAERLSIPAWGWNVSELQAQAKDILPLIGKSPSWKTSVKKAKWLTSMNSNERTAWSSLVNSTNDDSLEVLSTDLIKFVCRLALILYPSHLSALKALQQIRMPRAIIQDLEWFILSDAWTKLRHHHKVAAKATIHPSLRECI